MRPRTIVAGIIAAILLVCGGDAIDHVVEPDSLRFAPSERSMVLVAVEPSSHLAGWAEAHRSWSGSLWLAARLTWSLLVAAIFGAFICRDVALTSATQRGAGWKEVVGFTLPRTFQFWVTPILAVIAAIVLRGLGSMGSVAGYLPTVGPPIANAIFWFFQVCVWFLVGIVALTWPLMMAAQCIDGSDCFDGLSRGFNFILTQPLRFGLMLLSPVVLCFGPAHLISVGLDYFFNIQGHGIFLAGCVFAAVFTWAPFAFVELRRQVDSIEADEICIPRSVEFEPVPLAGRVAHPISGVETT